MRPDPSTVGTIERYATRVAAQQTESASSAGNAEDAGAAAASESLLHDLIATLRNDPYVLAAQRRVAKGLLAARDSTGAQALQEELVRAYGEKYGPEHPLTLEVTGELGVTQGLERRRHEMPGLLRKMFANLSFEGLSAAELGGLELAIEAYGWGYEDAARAVRSASAVLTGGTPRASALTTADGWLRALNASAADHLPMHSTDTSSRAIQAARGPHEIDPIAEARRHWEERWGAEPARPMAAITSIMRAQQVLLARLNELLGPFGLTFPRYEALMLLSFTRTGALPLGKVGERLQVHRTSVTHIIDKLEKDEFVRRVPHEADRRTTLAEITDSGRDVARRATALLNDDAFGLAALDDGEQEQLTELLRTLRVEAGDFTDVAFRADIST